MSEAASMAPPLSRDPQIGTALPGEQIPGTALTDRALLPVALLLFRLVLEEYADAGPDTARAMAILDRLQARHATSEAPILDRAATVALFAAVNRVRKLV